VVKSLRASLLVGAALTVVLSSCSAHSPNPISVGTVGRVTVVEVVDAPGTVVASASASVRAPADGTIQQLFVHDGQRVRARQLLMRISSPSAIRALRNAQHAAAAASSTPVVPPLTVTGPQQRADAAAQAAFASARRAALLIPNPTLRRQALAQVAQARAQYAAARAAAQTAIAQLNSGAASLQQALTALTSAQRTQSDLALQAAQHAVAALTVRAPIAGTVGFGSVAGGSSSSGLGGLSSQLGGSLSSQAQSLLGGGSSSTTTSGTIAHGSPVSAGQTLLSVTDVSSLSLLAQVDETDVLQVHRGIRASVAFDAVQGATYGAVVRTVDVNPTPSARGGVAYQTRLSLLPGRMSDGSVAPTPRPGMSALIKLHVATARNAVAVPAAAVFRDGNNDSVWLVVDGVAHKQTVTLGAQGADMLQVTSGLSVGQQIVVRGADAVHDGQHVP